MIKRQVGPKPYGSGHDAWCRPGLYDTEAERKLYDDGWERCFGKKKKKQRHIDGFIHKDDEQALEPPI